MLELRRLVLDLLQVLWVEFVEGLRLAHHLLGRMTLRALLLGQRASDVALGGLGEVLLARPVADLAPYPAQVGLHPSDGEPTRSPEADGVTDHAILWESGCNMARIHCTGIAAQMA